MTVENEAIQEDVSLEPMEVELPEEEIILSSRDQSIKDLVDSNSFSEEPSVLSVPEVDIPEEPDFVTEPDVVTDRSQETMTLRVNGEDVVKTFDEVKAIAQKHESGESRLKRASQISDEQDARELQLNQRQADIEAYHQKLLGQEEAQENTRLSSQEDVGNNSLEATKAFLENVYDGNTDDAAENLNALIGRQRPTQDIDVEALTRQVTESTVAKIETDKADKAYKDSVDAGVKWMGEEHPEILKDRVLYSVVNGETVVVMAENPHFTPAEVIREATERVANKVKGVEKTTGEPEVTTTPSSRSVNKANLTREPSRQSGKTHKQPVVEQVDNSPTAVLQRMKDNRSGIAGRNT